VSFSTAVHPLLDLPAAEVGPIPFRVATLDQSSRAVLAAAENLAAISARTGALDGAAESVGVPVHFANAYTVALADSDRNYLRLFTDPDSVVFTDGIPVAWFGRRLHPQYAQQWQRVYGPDVMTAVLMAAQPAGVRHFLLGGSPETLDLLRQRIEFLYPGAQIVGAESPPYRPLTDAEQAEQDARIRDSRATIVWVGLGTPKQDWEVARLARELPVVAMAVGAAFDFLAGTKAQAPEWMRESGTEWLFRFASEPRRLARRYLWGNPRFLRAASRGHGKELRRSVLRSRYPRVLDVAAPPRWEAGPRWPLQQLDKVAVLAHYSDQAEVSRSVATLVRELTAADFDVLVVSAGTPMVPLVWSDGLPARTSVYRRENIGYDFGTWASALAAFPQIAASPRVLLVNDSMVGPFSSMAPILDGFVGSTRSSSAAVEPVPPVWGLVGADDRGVHVQSHTVGYRDGVLKRSELRTFWRDIRMLPSKQQVIDRYEIGLAEVLRKAQIDVEVVFPSTLVVPEGLNATGQGWRRLLDFGFPFVKRELVTSPRWFLPDTADVPDVVRERFGQEIDQWL